ncbi:MAG: ornithine cyclodeaminase family protein [Candidatus Heimdallarchaeota archaeon]
MSEIMILSQEEVRSCLPMCDAIKAVEDAYKAFAEGRVQMPPVQHLHVDKYRGEIDIKSGFVDDFGLIGTKIASGYYDNPKQGLPPGIGIIVLLDLKTSLPLAVMDGTYITAVRTGAAGAVAARVLARKESKQVGMVGSGTQGRQQVLGLNELFPLELVKVWNINKNGREKYAMEMRERLGIDVQAVNSVKSAVSEADIVVTATPSRKALVMSEWIKEGTHINAIGADGPGKQEWDPKIMKRATKIVVDSLAQCRVIGELQHALNQGIIQESDVHAEIGEILLGMKAARETEDEITLFDSTGLSAQDIAASHIVYTLAKRKGLGQRVKLL